MSLTVPNDTEVIQREVKGGTEINCLPEGEPVRILGNTSTEGLGGETLRTHTRRRAA